jgi:hypothetical protein
MLLALMCFAFLGLVAASIANTGPELRISPQGRIRFTHERRAVVHHNSVFPRPAARPDVAGWVFWPLFFLSGTGCAFVFVIGLATVLKFLIGG